MSWIELQQGAVAEELYLASADAGFSYIEVDDAKASLWKACEKNLGESIPLRQGKNKKKSDIDDIDTALKKLKCGNTLPLILASGWMVRKAPVSNGIAMDSNNGYIVNRVAMLENSLISFMK